MGGTFDPVHYGHLFIAQTALSRLNLNKVLFIPAKIPPHKRKNIITDADKRVHMLNLAIESNPKFETSTIEIDRQKTSYTIDTVRELYQHHDEGTQFYFVMGSDAFKYIETWKEYKELFKIIEFIVMTRQILKNGSLDEKIKVLTKEHDAKIIKIEIPFLDISSTIIRKRVKEGEPIKYLLPESVEKYVFDKKLYID
ncbi:MAG: nicotinate-nucleotide adenylyltransferase [Clostridiales bacterium]|nr:nicotinate-nucleotide adenylyltransferase [Clostridiales bacterium]